MKYIFLVFGLVALLLLAACSTQPVAQEPTDDMLPAQQTESSSEAEVIVEYTLFISGDEFSPNVMEVSLGDVVRVTVANGQDVDGEEKPYDFLIPGLSVAEYVSTGDIFEFTAEETGDFEFYCSTCSPQIYGTLIVE